MTSSFLLKFSIICFVGVVFYNCAGNKNVQTVTNPNPSSELALLMRSMDADMRTLREDLQNDQNITDFREKYKAIHTATPTDANLRTPAFKAMSDAFLGSLDRLYADKSTRNYNLMINTCVSCHKQYCPGPVNRIKQLYLE